MIYKKTPPFPWPFQEFSIPLHRHCSLNTINLTLMEEKQFNNRTERMKWVAQQRGWGPLTEEDKMALDDIVRMVTNLDSKPRYAVSY